MHPECNILPILCPFFADRLADQNWIISDPRRSLAGVFNTTHWRIIEDRELQLPAVSAAEAVTQKLWRAFFDSIAVKERLNPKSQRGRMPKKYWRDLVEEPQT
jgi:probable DNA metabolism protein